MCDIVGAIVGRRLRTRRRLVGMTQLALGAACGITFQQVQKYECASCRLSVAMLWKLACALDVDIDYFFAGLPRDLDVAEGHRRRPAGKRRPGQPPERDVLPRADAA